MDKTGPGENPASAFARAARRLLAGRPGDSQTSKHVAERATEALERLAKHLTRLLGETGVQMLMERSIVIATKQFPWLRGMPALREAMEQQEPATITDAFVEVLSTFVGLLKRLIGDALVDRLLNEAWPAIFVPAAKDIP